MVATGGRHDRGETLVEVLVTVVILGIAGVAILAGVEITVKTSDIGRKEATSGTYARSVVEAIQQYVASGNYQNCAPANYYTGASATSTASNGDTWATRAAFVVPHGYKVAQSAAMSWNGAVWGSCSSDTGTQLLQLTVTSADSAGVHQANEHLAVVIRRPCSGALPSPC